MPGSTRSRIQVDGDVQDLLVKPGWSADHARLRNLVGEANQIAPSESNEAHGRICLIEDHRPRRRII
jgi:hypothetical protein